MQNSNGYTYIFEYTEPNWFRFFLYFILFINTHVDECRMYNLFVWVVHILESALLCHKNATLKSDCAHIYVHKDAERQTILNVSINCIIIETNT